MMTTADLAVVVFACSVVCFVTGTSDSVLEVSKLLEIVVVSAVLVVVCVELVPAVVVSVPIELSKLVWVLP